MNWLGVTGTRMATPTECRQNEITTLVIHFTLAVRNDFTCSVPLFNNAQVPRGGCTFV